jgi:hypothetical protein
MQPLLHTPLTLKQQHIQFLQCKFIQHLVLEFYLTASTIGLQNENWQYLERTWLSALHTMNPT